MRGDGCTVRLTGTVKLPAAPALMMTLAWYVPAVKPIPLAERMMLP